MKNYDVISKILDSLNQVNQNIRSLEKEYTRSASKLEQDMKKKNITVIKK